MKRFAIALATLIVAAALPVSSAGAGQLAGGHTPTVDPGATAIASRVDLGNTLRALAVLHRFGYSWTTDAGALKAIKHWQRVNGLVVDGIVGSQTLASLNLPATATAPAVRAPVVAVAPPPVPGDVEATIRSIWPAELADKAVAIAYRESRLVPTAINANGQASGLFQIMANIHLRWLCPQLNICTQSQLLDAHSNTEAAYALYQRDGGWGPWSL